MIFVNSCITDPGGSCNEDSLGYSDRAAWVIDGATGIGPSLAQPSDAAWLARRASFALSEILVESPNCGAAGALRQAMAICRDEFAELCDHTGRNPEFSPSAALAIIVDRGDRLELATLGDCRIAVHLPDKGTTVFGSSKAEQYEARTLAEAARILQQQPDIERAAMLDNLRPILASNRAMMNRPDGYWLFGLNPDAADYCDIMELDGGDLPSTLALASDGFLRLVELFALNTPADLIAMDSDAGLHHAITTLREAERAPDTSHRFLRIKKHDDATFLNIRWTKD